MTITKEFEKFANREKFEEVNERLKQYDTTRLRYKLGFNKQNGTCMIIEKAYVSAIEPDEELILIKDITFEELDEAFELFAKNKKKIK